MLSCRSSSCVVLVAGLFLALVAVFAASAAASPPDRLRPLRATTAPVIDGRLDEELWQQAPQATDFKTWMPDYGADLSERTVVYYAYDAENLYFAFRAFDREPSKIKASMASRDSIRQDDWICINLDSFDDQQSLYSFYVNPLGIQADSKFAANKEDMGFDAVWYSAGRLDDRGYTVEVRIPFKSLRYSRREPVTMGVVVERMISRKTEDGTIPGLDPKMGMNFLIQTQPIEFRDIRHYTLLEVLPAATYSRQQKAEAGALATQSAAADVGMTLKYGVTAQLTADAAVNPDFSQVEADAGQVDINLRAPLFFAEKRPFFLEGLDVYNFGGPQSSPLEAIVHTRTIVDPLVGAKLGGKLSRHDTISLLYSADELPTPDTAQAADGRRLANVGVLRYKRGLNQDAYVGGFVTDREEGARFNRVAGADGLLRLNDSAALGFVALGSTTRADDQSKAESGRALGVDFTRDTRGLLLSVGGYDISRAFATDVGYLTRTGVASVYATVGPRFYPKNRLLRRVDTVFTTQQTRDAFSGIWETYNEAVASLRIGGATTWQAVGRSSSEVYEGRRFGTSGFTTALTTQVNKRLRVSGSVGYHEGIYYSANPEGGRTLTGSATITYQPAEQWAEQATFTYANFDRADGERLYEYRILRSKTTFQLNQYLFFRGILEYNAYKRQLMTDLLASFTYIPGTVIHAGYGSLYERSRWDGAGYVPGSSLSEMRRGLFLKASYLWRL